MGGQWKAYQLLKSILNTAVDDELIRRNPRRIKGAGTPDTPERVMIPLTKVVEILTLRSGTARLCSSAPSQPALG